MMRAPAADLDAGLKRLHLPTIRRLYPELTAQAEKEDWTYRELLEQLVAEEIAHRQETRIQRSVRQARFPFLKTIEQFDFTFQASVQRKALGRFLGPELVEEGRSCVFLGRPGRGKTHLAIAIAYKAIENGYDARFTTAAALLNELNRAARDGRLEAAVRAYVEPHVLVIDELGYLSYGPDAANCLFQVIDERHLTRRRALVITSNKEPQSWGAVLHDADLAEAIVDRVMERGEVVRLHGRSFRNPQGREAAHEGAAVRASGGS
jgi:DNA replication protein DnaC